MKRILFLIINITCLNWICLAIDSVAGMIPEYSRNSMEVGNTNSTIRNGALYVNRIIDRKTVEVKYRTKKVYTLSGRAGHFLSGDFDGEKQSITCRVVSIDKDLKHVELECLVGYKPKDDNESVMKEKENASDTNGRKPKVK
jgi:hypothetical protein